jgi:hypothetical protein
LSQARFLAHLDQMLGSDLERSPLMRLLHRRTVIGWTNSSQELIARVGKELRLFTHCHPFTCAVVVDR